jgi:hypothetical protein
MPEMYLFQDIERNLSSDGTILPRSGGAFMKVHDAARPNDAGPSGGINRFFVDF